VADALKQPQAHDLIPPPTSGRRSRAEPGLIVYLDYRARDSSDFRPLAGFDAVYARAAAGRSLRHPTKAR